MGPAQLRLCINAVVAGLDRLDPPIPRFARMERMTAASPAYTCVYGVPA